MDIEQQLDSIEKQAINVLTKANQTHILAEIPKYSKEERLAFATQVNIASYYHGDQFSIIGSSTRSRLSRWNLELSTKGEEAPGRISRRS